MFTYDVTTLIGKMRLMLGDTNADTANFQDEELQAFADVTAAQVQGPSSFFGGGNIPDTELLLLSCATACDALGTRFSATHGQTLTLGDFQVITKDQVTAMNQMAQRFRDAVYNLPAWGIIEENTCGFNEMVIIRNWVLRTEF